MFEYAAVHDCMGAAAPLAASTATKQQNKHMYDESIYIYMIQYIYVLSVSVYVYQVPKSLLTMDETQDQERRVLWGTRIFVLFP